MVPVLTMTCSCTTHDDGSVTTMLCPIHADQDPCLTYAQVTGKRRKGSNRRGVCTNCGHVADRSKAVDVKALERDADAAYDREDQAWFNALNTEALEALWAIACDIINGGAAWDDEVFEALADRGYFKEVT